MPEARRRAVLDLAALIDPDPDHSQHVAQLALELFDSAAKAHGLGSVERELLECAALLHDVGASVNRSKHHRHSHYLILHSSLQGFEREEVRWIAAIARFHRGAPPKLTHHSLGEFDAEVRRRIVRLAAILRVADALDRGHQQTVRHLRLVRHGERAHIEIDAVGEEPVLELWAVRRKADLWERCFGAELGVRVRRANRRSARKRPGVLRDHDGELRVEHARSPGSERRPRSAARLH